MTVWSPIVYSRTRSADSWWRARPDVAADGWLDSVVLDTVSGGEDLEGQFRVACARRSAGTIVGVVSEVQAFNKGHHTDGGRQLYGFFGWHSTNPSARLPAYEELVSSWPSWASALYEEFVIAVWDRPPYDLRDAVVSEGRSRPWTTEQGAAADPLAESPGSIVVYPAAMGADVWARAALSAQPFFLINGWADASSARGTLATHVTAESADAEMLLARPRTKVDTPQAEESALPKATPGDTQPDVSGGAERPGCLCQRIWSRIGSRLKPRGVGRVRDKSGIESDQTGSVVDPFAYRDDAPPPKFFDRDNEPE